MPGSAGTGNGLAHLQRTSTHLSLLQRGHPTAQDGGALQADLKEDVLVMGEVGILRRAHDQGKGSPLNDQSIVGTQCPVSETEKGNVGWRP